MFNGHSLDSVTDDDRVKNDVFQPQFVQQLLHPATQTINSSVYREELQLINSTKQPAEHFL